MEKRKCEIGDMQAYLVRRKLDNAVVAVVCAIVHDGVVRMKNLVVAPKHRRQGHALATVQLLWHMAEKQYPGSCFCVFAIKGGYGERVYRDKAGMLPVTRQYEWSRKLYSTYIA
uniref:N-acetyltransferase domain-containing protein n=1 Tax=Helicotheca tamesis TaxID=374047 RepID=A0A7S2IGY7_9STRA|mmetsp:Transcript_9078/g.12583  ORF Transcript_9078/g.12583 Transcript_9078/m.12583 type:complete len:114 (+) Transcript_9078:248-589(+)